MDNDQRDRRDWPASDASGEASEEATRPAGEETVPEEATASEPPPAPDWGATEPPERPVEDAPAEMESWPAADASAGDEDAGEPAEVRAWPTEPPAAGSGTAGSWPTTPPERDEVPETVEAAPETTTPAAHEPSWPAEPAPPGRTTEPDWGASAAAEEPAGGPPPEEVEAHPAASEPVLDASGAAAMAAASASAQGVPDAEAATGESTQCPRCGTENRPGLAFCRNCGQRLVAAGVATTVERPAAPEGTQACPRCGTHNRAGTAFCQNCGANLRGTAPGYVPPAVAGEAPAAAARERGGAVLGPVVLLIGLIGLVTGYLLPFRYGADSLFERAFGAGGYGAAFWSGYPDVEAGLQHQAYFGLAAPLPLLGIVLLTLAVAGLVRARPGGLQTIGLVIALIWSVGLAVLFVLVEVAGNQGGDLIGMLRDLTPAGIIFFLASLIVLIGTLTRFGRS